MDRGGQGRAGRDRGARGRILGRRCAGLPVSGAGTGWGGGASHALSTVNLWRRLQARAHPAVAQILCAKTDPRRHLAVNRRGRGDSADSDAIRSNRVPKVKAERGPVAFWNRSRCQATPECFTRGKRQPITVASTAMPASWFCQRLSLDIAAGERQLIRSAVILAQHFDRQARRRFTGSVEFRQTSIARCHSKNLP
ncbi:hypothetical protein ACVILJ_002942 [Bradyrhizobium diazoefficiens]